MRIIDLRDVVEDDTGRLEFLDIVKKGEIFIYPTDTVYGIGCSIANGEGIKKICEAKQRDPRKPLSVIAPSVQWVEEKCQISEFNRALLSQMLPGPYTLILKAKKDSGLPKPVLSTENTIGVRIPRHRLTDIIRETGVAIITTSVNISGQSPSTKIDDIPDAIKSIAIIAIDSGEVNNEPSRVFDLTSDDIKILRW